VVQVMRVLEAVEEVEREEMRRGAEGPQKLTR
jgi:hypothetical protein